MYVEVACEPLLPGSVAYGGRLAESSERRLALKLADGFDMERAIVALAPWFAPCGVFIVW